MGSVESRRTTTTQTILLQCLHGLDLDVFISSETSEVIASEIGDSLARCEFGLGAVGANDDGYGCEFGFLLRRQRLSERLGSPLVDKFINFLVTRCE